jgi:tetratricopeptide (TPR) repeat protein/serine/threonine protein kinase
MIMNEETLFHLALEHPAAERAAFLEKMCGGDNGFRQRVQRLLDAHDNPGGFLGQPPVRGPATVDTPAPAEGPGSRIGPYKLLQQIGEGGMGTVFMAEQTEPVRRLVAVKVIKAGMDSRQVIARFEAERQALALMDHPNIAKVFDAGTTEASHPYFVMELVKGVPITKYCDEHHLTPQQRLELFVPVCRAVQHAHHKGIIHRDLKPSNVLVAQYDGNPVPKVIDFGVAKATGQKLTDKTLFTDFGAVVGTLEYMSPEQAELNQLDIDTRSDIYSLGVLLYELLTGTTPLERKRVHRAAILVVLQLIREEEPPRPSTRLSTTEELPSIAANRGLEPKKLSGQVRGDLDWIVMKCLEKDRNRRYETANGLAADVQRYLEDEPVLASPPSAAYRLRKFARRNKTALRTTATVLLVLLVATSGFGWALWDRAEQQAAQQVEVGKRKAETERAVSVALVKAEQLAEQARKLPSISSGEAAAALVVWRQAADALGQAEAALSTGTADDALRQRVAPLLAQVEKGRQQTEHEKVQAQRKEQLFRALDEARMARSVLVENHFDYARAVAKYAAAFAAYGLDVVGEAREELARRIATQPADVRDALLVALDDWAYSAAQVQGASSAKDLRALAEAADNDPWRKRYRAAVTANDRAALRDLSAEARRSSLPSSSLVLLARSLELREQRDEALALLRFGRSRHPTDFWIQFDLGSLLRVAKATPVEIEEAIGCYRAALALRPAASVVHNHLGIALHAKKQVDEAMAEYRKAIELDPKDPNAYNNLGIGLKDKNQVDAAIAAYKKAIDLDSKYAPAHTNLGLALVAMNQLDEAIAEFKKAVQLDPKVAQARNNLGNALVAKKQVDMAIAEYRKAIELDPKDALAHDNLGNALKIMNRLEEAISEHKRAIDLDPLYPPAHNNLGNALQTKGQWDGASAEYKKAIELDPQYAAAHNNLGVALQAKKQLNAAIVEFKKAIELDPKLAGAHYHLGTVLYAKNQFDEAIGEFRIAIEIDPHLAHVHFALGVALRAKKQVDAAIAEYRKAIELDPKFAQAHYKLADALNTKDRWDEAIAEYKKAIELDPKDALAYASLGTAFYAKNQWDEAIAAYKKAIELDPKLANAYRGLGSALHSKNQLDGAIAAYQQASALDPKNAPTHYILGNALKAKNRLDEAIAEFHKAIELQPDYAEAHCNLGLGLRSKGQLAASLEAYKRGHALGSQRQDWRYPSAQWVADAQRLVQWEEKLPDIIAGKAAPADNRERLGLIEVCGLTHRHAAAARLYADAFSADAKLAENLKAAHRYKAACAAALAAAGKGKDTNQLDEKERAHLRKLALEWLRADLTLSGKRLEESKADRQATRQIFQHWQSDTDLAGVRDAAALQKLPAEELEAWRQLWADVAQLLKKADGAK